MIALHDKGELKGEELVDLMGLVNTIITHITDGNSVEERLVGVMGGKILETDSERLLRVGEERGIAIGEERGIAIGEERGEARGEERGIRSLVETCQEVGLSIADATEKLISKFGLSEKASMAKIEQYWKN